MAGELAIRPEQPGDEEAIDAVVSRAFQNMDEANLVRMLRERQPQFDRRLSLCAWLGNHMVGYAAFIPLSMRLMGQRIPAAAVAPVAVAPAYQGQGIGSRILQRGHELARARGIELTFLNGHPAYYRRLGYLACFGFCQTSVDWKELPEPTVELEAWPVRAEDLPWLVAADEREWQEVDFTWPRGDRLTEWTVAGVNAIMWRTPDGRRAAYTLARAGQRGPGIHLEVVLGEDPHLVRQVIAYLKPGQLTHHPAGWLARSVLRERWATCQAKRSPAAMAYPLVEGTLDQYLAAVEAGHRLPGVCNWPIPFMMC